jgi:hypothetical protein
MNWSKKFQHLSWASMNTIWLKHYKTFQTRLQVFWILRHIYWKRFHFTITLQDCWVHCHQILFLSHILVKWRMFLEISNTAVLPNLLHGSTFQNETMAFPKLAPLPPSGKNTYSVGSKKKQWSHSQAPSTWPNGTDIFTRRHKHSQIVERTGLILEYWMIGTSPEKQQ